MANEMTLLEFLGKLSDFFPGGLTKEKTASVLSEYQDIILEETQKTGKIYDYKKLLHYVLKVHKFKTYPSVADLIEWLPAGEKREFQEHLYDDGTVRLKLKSGVTYDFVKDKCMSLKDIKSYFYKKHTSVQSDCGVYCDIEWLKYIPSNYTVMGDKAIDNISGEWINEEKWETV
jgi:hypothetical protein